MPAVVNKTIQVYPKQRDFLESKALLRAFVGGIGSGKSWIGALDMIRRSKPGRLYLVTAPTYPLLSDATFRSFTGLANQLGLVAAGDTKSSPPPSVKLGNGAEVLFRSTDNYDMLRGPNLSGVWMDEASLSKKEAFDVLIGRLREGGEQGWLTATFTPKGRAHWTYKTFKPGEEDDTFLVHATSTENPFLPPGFVAQVRKRYTREQAKQELGGEFLEGGGNHYFPDLWPRYHDVGDSYRIQFGDRSHHYRKVECNRLLALDWAMGKPKNTTRAKQEAAIGELRGDHTAFTVADLTPDGNLLLVYCLCERIPIGQNAPRLAEVCRRWRPEVVAGDDDNLSEAMLLDVRRYPDIPTARSMPIGGRNKIVRSQSAIVRAERGQLYLPSDERSPRHGGWPEMLGDYLAAFTGADGEEDDVADTVSILGRLADEFVPGEQVADESVVPPTEHFGGELYDYGADNRGMYG